MADTNRLVLPLLAASQAQKHVTVNEALKLLDAIVQAGVLDKDLTAPPGAPTEGDIYIVGGSATGVWAEHDDDLAIYQDGTWAFITPLTGWVVWVNDEAALNIYSDGAWGALTLTTAGSVSMLGINGATPDSTNRLSINTTGVLFNNDGSDIAVSFNKNAAADDAGFYLQNGFTTKAIIGLMGSDDFSIRVSPDGSTFYSGVSIDKDTGNVGIGTAGDANNKLTVAGGALFSSANDVRFTFSKGATADDASLTFQSNFSGRALIGLLGSDDFTFTVSPDGGTYTQAMVIDKTKASLDLPQHPKFSAYVNYDKYLASADWLMIPSNVARHNDQAAWAAGVFTAPHDGYYVFGGGYVFKLNSAAPSTMKIGVSVNGADPTADTVSSMSGAIGTGDSVSTTAFLKLSEGDTVELMCFFAGNDGYVAADTNYFWGHQAP